MQKASLFKYLLISFFLCLEAIGNAHLPTFFNYSQKETEPLATHSSLEKLSSFDLQKWDDHFDFFLKQKNHDQDSQRRVYTYLYTAQRDFAFLSWEIKGSLEGSFDPICAIIFYLFFPDKPLPNHLTTDTYSEVLAHIIGEKYIQRWKEETPKRWFLWQIDPRKLKINPPPQLGNPTWKEQLNAVIQAFKYITPEQTKIVNFWSKKPDNHDWRDLLNEVLFSEEYPLLTTSLARSLASIAILDSFVISHWVKQIYLIKRPFLETDQIHPFIHAPSSPSYPSTRATTSWASFEVLSFLFPEKISYWTKLAKESSFARVWAGVHYPQDIEEGKRLGIQIGQQIADNCKNFILK